MTKQVHVTNEQLASHAREIARAFGVALHEDIPDHAPERSFYTLKGGMDVVDGLGIALVAPGVHVARITCDAIYAVAMHELGHALAPLGHFREKGNVLQRFDEELAAWEWAEHYALAWTPAMEHVKAQSLGSYRDALEAWKRAQVAAIVNKYAVPTTRPATSRDAAGFIKNGGRK